MNAIKSKLLLTLAKNKKKDEGFTLIELLVVIIIIGVLSAVALPNLLSQVGKARESEAKNGVGSINRGQQAYFTENSQFASPKGNLNAIRDTLGVGIETEFYDSISIGASNGTDNSSSSVLFSNTEALNDGTRDYAGAVAFNGASQAFSSVVCRNPEPSSKAIAKGSLNIKSGTVACGSSVENVGG